MTAPEARLISAPTSQRYSAVIVARPMYGRINYRSDPGYHSQPLARSQGGSPDRPASYSDHTGQCRSDNID